VGEGKEKKRKGKEKAQRGEVSHKEQGFYMLAR